MKQLTISIREEQSDKLDQIRDENKSRNQQFRDLLDEYFEDRKDQDRLREKISNLETELEIKENKIEELRSQMKQRENTQEKVQELEKKVDKQQEAMNTPFFIRWYKYFSKNNKEKEPKETNSL